MDILTAAAVGMRLDAARTSTYATPVLYSYILQAL
jgi:hypothetical protein